MLKNEPTPANFARHRRQRVILEGICFSAFLVFYTLARNGKMLGSADMIQVHPTAAGRGPTSTCSPTCTTPSRAPKLYDEAFRHDAIQLIRDAVDSEVAWGQYIIRAASWA